MSNKRPCGAPPRFSIRDIIWRPTSAVEIKQIEGNIILRNSNEYYETANLSRLFRYAEPPLNKTVKQITMQNSPCV